jgi:transcriptional regulator with XRE-family HTH domain
VASSVDNDADKSDNSRRKVRDAVVDGLGQEVARQRKQKQLKVSELARMVGVSPSLISQIERGHSQPSVSTLFALSKALGTSVDSFFARGEEGAEVASQGAAAVSVEAAPVSHSAAQAWASPSEQAAQATQVVDRRDRYLVRRVDRDTIDIEGGVRWERLIPQMNSAVDFVEIVYEPGAQSHTDLFQHPGSEMVLVLSGTFEITVGFETYTLEAGDSIHFPSTIPHRYVNPSDEEEARAVTVNMRSYASVK